MFGIETKNENVKLFYPISNVGGFKMHTWTKKKGVNFYTFICIGAGAAGGNGFSAAAAAARGGGGGGGSGAISRLRIHASFLPNTLYFYVGLGGVQGGTATGELSFISVSNKITAINQNINLLMRSGAAVASAGGNGTGAAAGALGAASTIEVATNGIFSAWGEFIAIAGSAGVAGGVHTGANGTGITALTVPLTGGTGGAGVTASNFAGGALSISSGFLYPTLTGGIAGGGGGTDGILLRNPFRMMGGTGGGSNNTGVGGAGGNGAIGCGGGGGGGGTTGGTGGKGGNGCIIVIEEY